MLRDNKAQVGETMTWIVATLVIIVILSVSVFIVSTLTKNPLFGNNRIFKSERKADLIATKSLVHYLLSDENGILYDKLKNKGNDFGDSKNLIEDLYKNDYNEEVDLYIVSKDDFFVSDVVEEIGCEVETRIELNNEKDILLCLGRK